MNARDVRGMNKLHEFSTGAYETFDGIESVVEEVLGRIGRLNRDAWVVDATVNDFEGSVLQNMAQKYEMKTADARGVATGVNECIARSGANREAIACVVASNPCVVLPPLMVLPVEAVFPDEYVDIYQMDNARVFVRRDLARRVGVKTMGFIGKKNGVSCE